MTVLYVTSEHAKAGKTALCAALAQIIGQNGKQAAVFKPVAAANSGTNSDHDAVLFQKLLNQQPDGWPLDVPATGLGPGIVEEIKSAFERVANGVDVVLVEGSSSLSVRDSATLAEALDARALVVAQYQRDLAPSDLQSWQFGSRLAGVVINGLTRYMGTDARNRLLPSMESEGSVCLGIIPEDRRLLAVTVGQIAEHLDGRFIGSEQNTDAVVEYLMVGGMGMDPGELYFGSRQNKAVIVRGDRPDVQMSSLTTPAACMVLTKGIEPIEYVKYEAEQEEVPIIVVETDTLTTMDTLSSLLDRARFDHPFKLDRFAELVQNHVDLEALYRDLELEV